jgi:uncharacterized surface protein with fasciclin (FAS1) repeats
MKKINFIGRYTAFFLIVTLFSGIIISCKEDEDDVVKPETITDVILHNSEFSTLREIILANDLSDALRTENLTLFAPNNAAFVSSGITSAMVNSMDKDNDKDSARAFVFKHLIKERLLYDNLEAKTYQGFVKGDSIIISKKGSDPTLYLNNTASIITKNVNADNGMIQVVNKTLTTIK